MAVLDDLVKTGMWKATAQVVADIPGVGTSATAAELNTAAGVTAGTVAASKHVVVDANKDVSEFRNLTATNVIVGVGGSINSDSGTTTGAAGAATLNKMAGVVTTESLTTAGLAAYTLTLTNSAIAAADIVLVSIAGAGTGTAVLGKVTPAAGSVVILIQNVHATVAFNAAAVVSFLVVKA